MSDEKSNMLPLRWEYEDELPKDINKGEFDNMFKLSKVVGVRLYPYILVNKNNAIPGRFNP